MTSLEKKKIADALEAIGKAVEDIDRRLRALEAELAERRRVKR